ncbi:hypothetical protein NUITMVR1_00570 [Raoultella ornithinolytica]|nr:hypothetical protein NUITMVR1_00570 [Raoultella ornithinolytica]
MSLLWSVIRVSERSQRTCSLKYDGYIQIITIPPGLAGVFISGAVVKYLYKLTLV